MRLAFAVAALAFATPLQAQDRALYAGAVYCDSPSSLVEQERLGYGSGPWARYMDLGTCLVAQGGEPVAVFPAGPNGTPLYLDGAEVVCLTGPQWSGCVYSRWGAVYG